VAEADPALLIADDDQRGKAEAASALHDLRHAIDVDEPIDELAVAVVPIVSAAAAAFFTSHLVSPSLARATPARWVL